MKNDKDALEYGKKEYELFMKMPERARILFLDCLADGDCLDLIASIGLPELDGNSPIEQIYYLAFFLFTFPPSDISKYYLESQEEIKCGNKTYYADFALYKMENRTETETRILIELDGHDFHEKTKEQVEKDKERELNIKLQGYDIIRFSGSQVYKNPMLCVKKTLKYALIKEGVIDGK